MPKHVVRSHPDDTPAEVGESFDPFDVATPLRRAREVMLALVFERQALGFEREVYASDEITGVVDDLERRSRLGQSGVDHEEPRPGLGARRCTVADPGQRATQVFGLHSTPRGQCPPQLIDCRQRPGVVGVLGLSHQRVSDGDQVVRVGKVPGQLDPRGRRRTHSDAELRMIPDVNPGPAHRMPPNSTPFRRAPREDDGHVDGTQRRQRSGQGKSPHDRGTAVTDERIRGHSGGVREDGIQMFPGTGLETRPHPVERSIQASRPQKPRSRSEFERLPHAESRPELGRQATRIHLSSVPCRVQPVAPRQPLLGRTPPLTAMGRSVNGCRAREPGRPTRRCRPRASARRSRCPRSP